MEPSKVALKQKKISKENDKKWLDDPGDPIIRGESI